MKTKLLLYGTAFAMLCIQSCKKETAVKSVSGTNGNKKVTATVAYQDNTITNWFKRNANSLGSVAYDQAFSVPLASGKVLWLFGDTFYNDLDANGKVPCWTATSGPAFNLHNSVLSQPSTTNWTQSATTNLLRSGSAEIFKAYNVPGGGTNNYFWPCTGVEINNKVYTYLFKMNGITASNPKLGILNLTTNTVDTTTMVLPNLNGISFNIGMLKIGTYVYLWGYKVTGPYAISSIYVARSPIAGGAMTFWNGSTWVSSAASAAVIATTSSNAVSVSQVNGKFVLIHTYWSLQCSTVSGADAVYAQTSANATGPFNAVTTIYHIPDRKSGAIPFFYTPLIHPEFTANNEFLFTYCINYYSPCVNSCVNSKADPDEYRPRAVRVPFSVLGL
ncbi:MAG: hypothetical protein ABIN95_14360 [Mucilaginibacter sp.]